MLGEIGDVLSAPRRGLMNLLGLPEEGSQLVSNLTGLDHDGLAARMLGMGAEVLTDPLTWAGGLAGLAGRRLLPAGFGALGKAGAVGDAAPALREGLAGVPALRNAQLAENMGEGAVLRHQGRAMVFSNPVGTEGKSLVAEVARGRHLPDAQLQGLADEMAPSAYRSGGNSFYDPTARATATNDIRHELGMAAGVPYEEAEPLAQEALGGMGSKEYNRLQGRHEAVHALIDSARSQGGQGLPWAVRGPAALPSFNDPAAAGATRALSLVADETAAHALQHRSTLNQVLGGAGFLFNPARNAEYAGQIAALSPSVGALYGALPGAAVGAAAAAGGGAGMLGRHLSGETSGPY